MSNISIGNLNDNYISIDFAGKTDPTDTYRFNRLNPGSFRVTAEGFSSVVGMQLLDTQGKVVKDIETNGTNSGTFSIDNLGATNYALKISAPSRDTNYQVSLTPDGKVDPLTGLGVTSGFFTPDSTGQVGFDWLHDGGNYIGEVAIFSVQGMEKFTPGSEEFIKEVARRALTNSTFGHVVISDPTEGANPLFDGILGEPNYNEGPYSGPKTFAMKPGEPFAVMLVPNGTVQDVFNNPGVGGDKRPLLSLSSTNPNDAFLYGQIADVTGNGKAFAMEDQRVDQGSDKDYNDLVFNLTGATGKAVAIDKVIAPAKDWTKLDGGKKLIDYVKSKLPVVVTPPVVTPPVVTPPVDLKPPVVTPPVVTPPVDLKPPVVTPPVVTPPVDPKPPVAVTPPVAVIPPVVVTPPVDLKPPVVVTPPVAVIPPVVVTPPVDLKPPVVVTPPVDLKPPVVVTPPVVIQPPVTILPISPRIPPVEPPKIVPEPPKIELPPTPDEAPVETVLPISLPAEKRAFIGIIDTGFAPNNPDLDYSKVTLGRDRIDKDSNPLFTAGTGNEHGTFNWGLVSAIQGNDKGIDGYNDKANVYLSRAIGSGEWDLALTDFVGEAKAQKQKNAIALLPLDLTQKNADGTITTRYEFTNRERAALENARQSGVLLVVAAGNDGGVMSVLGQSSQEFENIITVGSSDGFGRSDYSSYGYGLDILVPGGAIDNPTLSTVGDDLGTMSGTSASAAKAAGMASKVWESNPDLSVTQVIDILTGSAIDLKEPGWDKETGFGVVNLNKAVAMAKETKPQSYTPSPFLSPTTWGLEGKVTPWERATYDIKTGNFTSIIWSPNGVNLRNSTNLSDRSDVSIGSKGQTFTFDAWTYGEAVPDITTDKPDALWFRINQNGKSYWVPSAFTKGYPPGNPPLLPPANTNPVVTPPTSNPVVTPPTSNPVITPPTSISLNGRTIGGNFYPVFQNSKGTLGNPTSDVITSGGVSYQLFDKGSIVSSKNGTFPLYGAIRQEFLKTGGLDGRLGAPKSEEKGLGDGTLIQYFEKGHISWNGVKAIAYEEGKSIPSTTPPTLGNQPNTGMPDFNKAAYRENNPLWQNGYAPGSTNPPTPKLGLAKGNCTWYANGRLRELGYDSSVLDKLIVNASDWDDRAAAAGISMSKTPQVGDIAQWESNHVAVVEKVNSDGTILISESSYSPNSGSSIDYLYGTRTISASNPSRFIHVPYSGPSSSGSSGNQIGGGSTGSIEYGSFVPQSLYVTPQFLAKVSSISQNLGVPAEYLMAAMGFETGGTYSPNIVNSIGATGLIQFIPSTAKGLGTSTQALANMSAIQQLDYVEKYFSDYKGRLKSLSDVYMAVLWPKAIGKNSDQPLWSQGTDEYTQNNGLDLNKNGVVTVGEATTLVRKYLPSKNLFA